LRTAECAGVTGVILGRHRSVHISPTVTKTAAGAVEHVPLALVGGIPSVIAQMNDLGIFTVGLDGAGDRSIFDLPQLETGPTALVLGAEGAGLSRLVRQRVGVLASIPLGGQLNSLNVATATAVACFEVVRARRGASTG
ncbi:MAG: RNA methyltransferase, partial [Actinomycetota bacterium]